jgi:hypothetical protein
MIKIKNFYKISLILLLSLSLTYYLTVKSQINYKSKILKITINIFYDEVTDLNNLKLFYLNGYQIISNHFGSKKISSRIITKMNDEDSFCPRKPDAKKRNATVKAAGSKINMEIIFSNDENLSKCKDKIKDYIISQKIFYIKEVKSLLKNLNENEVKNYQAWKIDTDIKKEKLLKELGDSKINFIYNSPNYIDHRKAEDIFKEIISSEIFSLTSKIEEQNINIKLVRFILFISLFISMSFLFVDKELKLKIINFFKKKILD